MEWEMLYSEDLAKNLSRLRQERSFTDVTIHVGPQDFHCHKVILAAVSTYFEIMFSTEMMEKRTGEVKLEETSPEIFSTLLTFIYTGKKVVNIDNANELLALAMLMNIPSLRICCEAFLLDYVEPSTCIRTWRMAYLHECDVQITERAWSLLLKHFEEIWNTNDFDFIPKDHLFLVLKDAHLNVSSNEIICKAGLKWLVADFENRDCYAVELLDFLTSLPGCKQLIRTIISEYDEPAFQRKIMEHLEHMKSAVRNEKQISVVSDDALLVIGGNERGSNQMLACFSHCLKKWCVLCPPPVDPGFNFAVCNLENSLFMSGGTSNSLGFLEYSGEDNSWSQRPNLPHNEGRVFHSMAAVKGGIFVFGGVANLNTKPIVYVDKFVPSTQQWKESGCMAKPMRSMACCSVGTDIFLIGGLNENFVTSDLIQCFDTKDNTSYYYQYKMPVQSNIKAKAVCIDGLLYIICRSGEVVAFKPKSRPAVIGTVKHFPRTGFGVSTVGRRIMVVGGEVGLTCTNEMLLYDTVTKETIMMQENVPISLQDFGSITMTIPRYHLTNEMKTDLMPV